jgi:integrase
MALHMVSHMGVHMVFHMGVHMGYKYRYQERYKDRRIDCVAHTKKELLEKVAKKKEQIDRQTIDQQMRLEVFCQLYLDTYKRENVSASWFADLCRMKSEMVAVVGNKPVGKIKPMEMQNFINQHSELADSTIKKIYDFTKQITHHMVVNGATDYVFNLTAPKGRTGEVGRSLTKQEQDALLRAIKGHRAEIFISIMYYCGLRPSEVSALQWKDIDLEKNIISVYKAVKQNGSIGDTKSPSGVREVPVPIKLSILLKKHRKSPFSPVCVQRNGHHTKWSVRRMWQDIKKRTEAELGRPFDARLYDIRHTYCTNLEKAGVPINIASRLMGHSNIAITSKIYTHASDEAVEIARKCIDAT